MRRPQGYGVWTDRVTGKVIGETDTVTCVHCNGVTRIPAKAAPADLGGWCGRCAAYICATCAEHGRCTPFEKQLEASEARGRMLAAIGIG